MISWFPVPLRVVCAVVLAGCAPQQSTGNAGPPPLEPVAHASSGYRETSDMPGREPSPLVSLVRDAVVEHAPYKQFDPARSRYNLEVGRTPAAACDAMTFLVRYLEHFPEDTEARDTLEDLARWVLDLQESTAEAFGVRAVPSTPDAPSPRDRFFYAIDAALCGTAMLETYRRTGEGSYLDAAVGFGLFLDHLGEAQERVFAGSTAAGAFCEYATPQGGRLAYNCDSYVKTMVALGFLRDLATATGQRRFLERADAARRFLLPGLQGAWEYADAQAALQCRTAPCAVEWRRVPGPRGEPDHFVYGDTLAYALAGLHAFEGASEDVSRLYRQFAGFRGDGARTRAYDGGIAFAGYIEAAGRRPDPASSYYDVVTIGILSPLRRDLAPEHDERAWSFLERLLAGGSVPRWGVGFEGEPIGIDDADLTTLSTLGIAAIDRQGPGAVRREAAR